MIAHILSQISLPRKMGGMRRSVTMTQTPTKTDRPTAACGRARTEHDCVESVLLDASRQQDPRTESETATVYKARLLVYTCSFTTNTRCSDHRRNYPLHDCPLPRNERPHTFPGVSDTGRRPPPNSTLASSNRYSTMTDLFILRVIPFRSPRCFYRPSEEAIHERVSCQLDVPLNLRGKQNPNVNVYTPGKR